MTLDPDDTPNVGMKTEDCVPPQPMTSQLFAKYEQQAESNVRAMNLPSTPPPKPSVEVARAIYSKQVNVLAPLLGAQTILVAADSDIESALTTSAVARIRNVAND